MFTLSETKLNRVLRSTTTAVQDMGLHWNPKKRNVIHVRRGKQAEDVADLRLDETALVENLTTGSYYTFLGVRESVILDEKLQHSQLRQRCTCKGSY